MSTGHESTTTTGNVYVQTLDANVAHAVNSRPLRFWKGLLWREAKTEGSEYSSGTRGVGRSSDSNLTEFDGVDGDDILQVPDKYGS